MVVIAYLCVTNCAERHIHGMMYMGNVIAWLLRRKLYTWHNVYREKKKWNAKVMNYNLRGSEKEKNMKVLNSFEINKRSGWKLAPLR